MEDIQVIHVEGALQITDYFVLASGRNSRHLKAASDEILRKLREVGARRRGLEGYREGKWVLLDFGDVVVHLFLGENRGYYSPRGPLGRLPAARLGCERRIVPRRGPPENGGRELSGAPPEARRAFVTDSPAETLRLARSLGRLLGGGEVIALVGELGSGKTLFTRGLCEGAGLQDSRLVTSPTYVLEQIYSARVPVHHYDLYRLSSPAEFAALGFEEHLGRSDVLVIEWADRAGGALPADRLLVELSLDEREPERRTIVFSAAPSWADRIARLDARIS